jgi:hypothetical protein
VSAQQSPGDAEPAEDLDIETSDDLALPGSAWVPSAEEALSDQDLVPMSDLVPSAQDTHVKDESAELEVLMYDVEDGLIVCFPCLRSPAVVTVDTRLRKSR